MGLVAGVNSHKAFPIGPFSLCFARVHVGAKLLARGSHRGKRCLFKPHQAFLAFSCAPAELQQGRTYWLATRVAVT